MAELSRTPDFLHRHANLGRRVRNLETGVHPTTADVDFFDSTEWAAVPLEPGFTIATSGINTAPLQWRKRVGIVTLAGGVTRSGGIDSLWPVGDSHVATLPPEARPSARLQMLGVRDNRTITNPMISVAIDPDGSVWVLDPAGELAAAGANDNVRFDGLTYIPDAAPVDG